MDSYYLAHIFIFLSTFISIFSLIPQIVLNYRLKKGDGISDGMLLCSFNGFITNNFYVFGCCMPLTYRIMVPVWTLLFAVILMQRLWYNGKKNRFPAIVGVNSIMYLGLVPFAYKDALLVGSILGWCMLVLWSVYQLPQMYKIYKEKSVFGFSFMLVFCIFIQAVLELIGAVILNLPRQTLINEVRNILFFFIFVGQFWRYKWRK